MTQEQRIKNLTPPTGKCDVILDTDTFNEVDDQFALAYAMLSINAAKGIEIGEGFKATQMLGSSYNDKQEQDFHFLTNHDGGIQAGISNGEEVCFQVAFKPIPTLRKTQDTIDFQGNAISYSGSDRNDRCVYPRVLPVVEAMAALVIADMMRLRG